MAQDFFIDAKNRRYLSSKAAAKVAGWTNDYIGRLCRKKKLLGQLIGKTWYVGEDSLRDLIAQQEGLRDQQKRELSLIRKNEYAQAFQEQFARAHSALATVTNKEALSPVFLKQTLSALAGLVTVFVCGWGIVYSWETLRDETHVGQATKDLSARALQAVSGMGEEISKTATKVWKAPRKATTAAEEKISDALAAAHTAEASRALVREFRSVASRSAQNFSKATNAVGVAGETIARTPSHLASSYFSVESRVESEWEFFSSTLSFGLDEFSFALSDLGERVMSLRETYETFAYAIAEGLNSFANTESDLGNAVVLSAHVGYKALDESAGASLDAFALSLHDLGAYVDALAAAGSSVSKESFDAYGNNIAEVTERILAAASLPLEASSFLGDSIGDLSAELARFYRHSANISLSGLASTLSPFESLAHRATAEGLEIQRVFGESARRLSSLEIENPFDSSFWKQKGFQNTAGAFSAGGKTRNVAITLYCGVSNFFGLSGCSEEKTSGAELAAAIKEDRQRLLTISKEKKVEAEIVSTPLQTGTKTATNQKGETEASSPKGSSSVIAYTQPVIERTIIESGVTENLLTLRLQQLENALKAEIYRLTSQSDALQKALTLTNRINTLSNVTVNNVTISSGSTVTGLTDADIPDTITASNYLKTSGGTLTGALTGTSVTLSGDLSVAGAQTLSGALNVPYISATSTTASSFIQASTTRFSVFDTAYFGGTATTTIGSAGSLTLPLTALLTAPYSSSTAITVSGTSFLTNILASASSTLQNFTALQSTSTNATATNFFSTTASSTNLFSAAGILGSLTATNLLANGSSTLQNFTFTNATGTSATSTNFFATTATLGNLTGTGSASFGTTLSVTGLSTLAGFISTASSTIGGNLTVTGNATATSATTTNFFATTASSTNLFATTGNIGALTAGALTFSGVTGPLQALSGVVSASSTLSVAYGGTGATTLNDLLTLGTHTTGNYLATLSSSGSITVGNSESESAAATVNINLGNANSWTALQSFANASSSLLSVTGTAYFGGTATSTFNSAGVLTLASALGVSSGGTATSTPGGFLYGPNDGTLVATTTISQNFLDPLVVLSSEIDTSSELAGILGDETGTGNLVFSASPTLTGTLTGASALFTASSTFTGNATTTGSHSVGALIANTDYITDFTGTGLALSGTALTTTLGTSIDLTAEVTGTLPIANGGTNNTSYSTNALLYFDGSKIAATSTQPLYVGQIAATTTTATSTFAGGLAIETSGFVYDYSSNRVGIGTAAPTVALDVTGAITASATGTASYFAASTLGAVGAPAFAFSGDLNTGVWSSAADTLNFSTAGSERARFDSAGNFGIGTTSPFARLSVAGGNVYIDQNLTAANITATGTLAVTGAATLSSTLGVTGLSTLAGFISTASSTIGGNLTVTGNATATNATTTNFFATTASSTNLFATTGNIGSLTAGALTVSALTGPLQALSGVVSASSTLSVAYGGTGATSLTGILKGNGAGAFTALTTSSGIAGEITDETGTGNLVFSASPTLTGTLTGASALFTASSTFTGNATTTGSHSVGALIANTDYITDFTGTGLALSGTALTASLGTSIAASEIADGDHGFFTYASGVASLDTGGLTSSNLLGALSDETGTGSAVFSANPTVTGTLTGASALFTASSTIGGGGQATGLTIAGGATTTGYLVVQGTGTSTYTGGISTTRLNTTATSTFAGLSIATQGLSIATLVSCNTIDTDASGNFTCGTDETGTGANPNSKWATSSDTGFGAANIYNVGLGNVGIGTTTPVWSLQVASQTPYIALTDTNATTDSKHWLLSAVEGIFRIGTSTDSLSATSTLFSINRSGDTTIAKNLTVSGTATSTFAGGLAIETSGFVYDFTTNRVGIGIATPQGVLQVKQSSDVNLMINTVTSGAITLNAINDANSQNIPLELRGSSVFVSTGNFGIGTTTPWRKLSVTDTSAQLATAYDGTRYTTFSTDSVGDLTIDAQGGDAFLLDENLWVCTGGACPSGSVSGTGNLVVETRLGVATSSPAYALDVFGDLRIDPAGRLIGPYSAAPTLDTNGQIAIDSTSNQLKYQSGGATRVLGNGNLYPSFTYATSTAWTGTTTIPLGTAFVAETWNGVQCFTDAGTLNISFNDGTNRMDLLNASTTVGTVTFTTNNTFTAAEKRYVDVGTPATSPTKISCTVSKSLTAD